MQAQLEPLGIGSGEAIDFDSILPGHPAPSADQASQSQADSEPSSVALSDNGDTHVGDWYEDLKLSAVVDRDEDEDNKYPDIE